MTAVATLAPARRETTGLLLGLVGVIAFSLTLPMTRVAVQELDPGFVAFGRMALAGLIAAVMLLVMRAPWPARELRGRLFACSFGVVFGFPFFTSLAMQTVPANHGAIIVGALPFATALLAALWFGERQTRRFWICAAIGSLLVVAFALRGGSNGGAALARGDLWMAIAVVLGAVGYASGGKLATQLGGIRTILWALVFALPVSLPIMGWMVLAAPPAAGAAAWGAFAYVTLISQVVGFFAWYNGLALGGIARVGQVQLLQVFFTIGFAALLFGESVAPSTWLFAAAVVATIVIGRKS
jgi:drug/metabolite transporter (DMT)-like permease